MKKKRFKREEEEKKRQWTYPVRVGRVAGSVVERRADRQRDRVAGIFDQVDNVTVVQTRYVVVVHGQNAVADVQPGATLGRTVADYLTCSNPIISIFNYCNH